MGGSTSCSFLRPPGHAPKKSASGARGRRFLGASGGCGSPPGSSGGSGGPPGRRKELQEAPPPMCRYHLK
eukprot:238633-Alexandrium_andersonii.AAC.1